MAVSTVNSTLHAWRPIPTPIPPEWQELADNLAQQVRGSLRGYVMDVKYNAQSVGNLLRSWGLPWQVVMAGYLWEYDEKTIRSANLWDATPIDISSKFPDIETVLEHINDSIRYVHYIEEEQLSELLFPPYHNIGALLVAVAIHYVTLKELQEQSHEQVYRYTTLMQIESIGRTLLNIGKRLGMWLFKRDVEDLLEQLRHPQEFVDMQQKYEDILKRDRKIIEHVAHMLQDTYMQATQKPVSIVENVCGIIGRQRRMQDAHTSTKTEKDHPTGLDLVTFDVIVSEVQDCYTAFGIFSQLGYIQDRVTDQIANPKPNGCSHLAFGLILNSQHTQQIIGDHKGKITCQLQIATSPMQAIASYGCLYPRCYAYYMNPAQSFIPAPDISEVMQGQEGKVFWTLAQALRDDKEHREKYSEQEPILVYNKERQPVALRKGASALDFAYAQSIDIGEHAIEAFINNRMAPLYRQLDAGDVVEIKTSPEIQVKPFWQEKNYATTPFARKHIQEFLQERSQEIKGYELLYQELHKRHYILKHEEIYRELQIIADQLNIKVTEYLERLAQDKEKPEWAIHKIIEQIEQRKETIHKDDERIGWIPVLDNLMEASQHIHTQVRLCDRCKPVYPGKITGRVNKHKKEIVVHKVNCPYLTKNTLKGQASSYSMSWKAQPPVSRVVFFAIAQDRQGLVLDIARQLRRHRCNLLSIEAKAHLKIKEAHVHFTIETYDDQEVLNICQELYKVSGIISIDLNAAEMPKSIYERLQKLLEQNAVVAGDVIADVGWKTDLATLKRYNLILKNPFDISRPATGRMFFGRSKETQLMYRELCDGEKGKALILYGPRRSGKSSLCQHFLECQIRPPFWSVLFSLQNFTHHSEEIILRQIASKVCQEFERQLHKSPPGWETYPVRDPQFHFRKVLEGCLEMVNSSRLILALDEFGGPIEAYEKGHLEERFFTYWKSLMTEIPQLSLILALPSSSHRTLTEKLPNTFSFAEPMNMHFLDKESARRLLVDPLRDQQVAIHPKTVALALHLTGGNPYYITLIGQQLINQLNIDTRKQVVTDEDLEHVVEHITLGFNSSFDFHIKELQSHNEWCILKHIVDITGRTRRSKVSLKSLSHALDVPGHILRQDIERLRNGLILEESLSHNKANPYYSFKVDLVRRWLERNSWFFRSSPFTII